MSLVDTRTLNHYQQNHHLKFNLAFKKIYRRVLRWPKLLQVDPGSEFRGDVASLMKKNNVIIRQGHTAIHRDQAIVERFNRTLADKLFGYQYAKEFIQQDRSREWVKRLPAVIKSINEIPSQKKKDYRDST